MRYKFTKTDCKRGGRSRARQLANDRRQSPTQAESCVREIATRLLPNGYTIDFELAIQTFCEQYFDIAISNGKVCIAIEVDGSRDWHNPNYSGSKMLEYDNAKRQYCQDHGIILLELHWADMWPDEIEKEIEHCYGKLVDN